VVLNRPPKEQEEIINKSKYYYKYYINIKVSIIENGLKKTNCRSIAEAGVCCGPCNPSKWRVT
jgi:hypothetical protein